MVYGGERELPFQPGVVLALVFPVGDVFDANVFRKLVVEGVRAVVDFVQPALAETRARGVGRHEAARFSHGAEGVVPRGDEKVEVGVGKDFFVRHVPVERVSVHIAEERANLLVF